MTTDTFPKTCVVRSEAKGKAVHIAGIAKGAGMIHPHMATMLSFITTDASMGERMLHNLLLGGGGRFLQSRHRGWRHFHQRYGGGAGQRPFGN